jgi:hypothetical protein
MALPDQLGDREYQKFEEDADGNVAVRIGPNAIRDSAGNELDLNSFGMAQVFDRQVASELKVIHGLLEDMLFHLQLITGAQNNE